MTLYLFLVFACLVFAGAEIWAGAIKDQHEADKDRSRQAWWPDPDNKDKGNENERPFIS